MNLIEHLLTGHSRRGTVGLDVGRRAIKAVRRERGRIVARNLVPWEPPAVLGGGDGAGVLAEAVGRAVGSFGLRKRQATTCVLSMSFGSLRGFELPASSDRELHEMVREEFAVDSRYEPSRAEVACWRSPGGDELQPVSGWALTHDVSRYVSNELKRAGLACVAIDVLPFALARAVAALGGTLAESPAAVVDWGAHSPSLTIVHRGRPLFTRALRECGHARVAERLALGLGLEPDEAWTFLDNFGPGSDTTAEMRQLLDEYARETAERLVAEVERTVEFLGERLQALAPRAILLFGGGAELVLEPLRRAFGTRVTTWAEAASLGANVALPSSFGVAACMSALEVVS